MSRPLIRIHNIETDEIVDREMNDDEFAAYEKDLEEIAAEKAKADALASEIATSIAAKAALLERLGITEEEAKLLLG